MTIRGKSGVMACYIQLNERNKGTNLLTGAFKKFMIIMKGETSVLHALFVPPFGGGMGVTMIEKLWKKRCIPVICIILAMVCGMIFRPELSAVGNAAKVKKNTAVAVKTHKQFVRQIYNMAVKRNSPGEFYCSGNGSKIFDGNMETLLQEICTIDEKTSDDADYLANNIASMNVHIKQEYRGSQILRSTYTVRIKYRETAAQLQTVNAGVEEALASLNVKGKSDYQKVKLIHDYIVNNTKYKTTANCYTAYGALMEGNAVCQGYALLAYKMLTEAGVKNYIISGKANNGKGMGDHGWNIVKVGRKWYYLDVTWDDPVGIEDVLTYQYFLVGKKQMKKDHTAAEKFKQKVKKVSNKNHKNWKKLQ